MSGSPEVVPALLCRVEAADLCGGIKHVGEGACADLPEMGLELGECHFDGIEVRAVGRQKEEPASGPSHRLFRCRVLVSGEIVQKDGCAGHQHFLNLCREGLAIHCIFDNPRIDHGL